MREHAPTADTAPLRYRQERPMPTRDFSSEMRPNSDRSVRFVLTERDAQLMAYVGFPAVQASILEAYAESGAIEVL